MKSIKKYVGIFLLALCLIGTMQAVPCKAASLNSNVNGIVKSQVLPEDTKEVKLQKLFQYQRRLMVTNDRLVSRIKKVGQKHMHRR
ncbi:MAG: hypothetical protein ACLTS6_01645 [Anaerobutyricum sp.]